MSGRNYDLCVIGSGSGNSVVDERFDDWRVAIVEGGTFGGTCVNVGCIPTKMYAYPADLAVMPAHAGPLGVDLDLTGVDWAEIRDRIFGRVDAMSAEGRRWRERGANVDFYPARARFVGERTLGVGDHTITADQFVLAAGSRPRIPDLPGLDQLPPELVHTSDTIMRVDALPASLVIVGGGYVAAEFAHVFSAYGTEVTVVARSARLLNSRDATIGQRFTELLGRRIRVLTRHQVSAVATRSGGGIDVAVQGEDRSEDLGAELLLLATGRIPNSDGLDLDAAGVDVDDDGFVVVDAQQRTSASGVFALGDLCSRQMLKHVANHEARVVGHNLLNPDDLIASDHRYVPSIVYADPQVASVGLTEQEADEQGEPYVTTIQEFGDVAYGWAMADHDHLCKLVADPRTGALLGAHMVGPQASLLLQPLIAAMSFGIGAVEFARGQYWPHPALSEVVENALLGLDVSPSPRPPATGPGSADPTD